MGNLKQASSLLALREYGPGDFERLWAIDQCCFEAELAYSRAELRFYIRLPGAFTLVADSEGEPVGFVVARIVRGTTGHIITIDVLAQWRRGGTGSLLLNAAEARLAGCGCKRITLETAVNNLAAIKFYHRHGYTAVRTLRDYYSNGIDAIAMEKAISQ